MKRGVIYIVFGDNARVAAASSIASLHAVMPQVSILIVGDEHGEALSKNIGTDFNRWAGENPYDSMMPNSFHFKAGRIKPFLYGISPYEKTLYVDADTEFQASPLAGFDLLERYDFMLAKHSSHNVGMLNNKPGDERMTTIQELGGCGDLPYPNSGVLFWRDSESTKRLFEAWSTEWMRFQEWDEQLALMRALYKNPLRLLLLPEAWNGENRKEGSIIFHDFHGHQIARTDVEKTLPDVFKNIHDVNHWPSTESKSGPGSEISHTERIREFLPKILRVLGVKSMLDAGCGDWNWMSQVKLGKIEYHGLDVVPALIAANMAKHPGHDFFVADLSRDKLPTCDLVLCRSVLFHLSFDNVHKVVANFKASGAMWLLTSTYPYYTGENKDIRDGSWHRLNLEKPPFSWPAPFLLMPEGEELDGWLGLWQLDTLV